mmetsp:Transcript_108882/g.306847  ORF Transcript_108882/g.306847 Transcript_108882/m.306847 type:complete len:284 (+) Transcript_108882:1116-1967(+)
MILSSMHGTAAVPRALRASSAQLRTEALRLCSSLAKRWAFWLTALPHVYNSGAMDPCTGMVPSPIAKKAVALEAVATRKASPTAARMARLLPLSRSASAAAWAAAVLPPTAPSARAAVVRTSSSSSAKARARLAAPSVPAASPNAPNASAAAARTCQLPSFASMAASSTIPWAGRKALKVLTAARRTRQEGSPRGSSSKQASTSRSGKEPAPTTRPNEVTAHQRTCQASSRIAATNVAASSAAAAPSRPRALAAAARTGHSRSRSSAPAREATSGASALATKP